MEEPKQEPEKEPERQDATVMLPTVAAGVRVHEPGKE